MVMADLKFCPKDHLLDWIKELSRERTVLVPQQCGEAVEFRPFIQGSELFFERQPTAPPKKSVFPQTEPLLCYAYEKDPDDPGKQRLQIRETLPEARQTVVLGCRPCGARGFTVFDPVYADGEIADPYYQTRRDATIFIALACERPEPTCFCHWVGSGPADEAGSDVLMIPLSRGFALKPVTDKGRQLLEAGDFKEATQEQSDEAEQMVRDAEARLAPAPDLEAVPEKLLELFENKGFWEQMSAKCISCGACTYLCPTCYCFNISDEYSGLRGKRIRTWDNCMSNLFTQEASGHNPRSLKAQRLRNRVGHKFSYYPKLHDQIFACCGCGRCIKSCPMSVDIRDIVLSAKEFSDAQSVSA